MKEPIEPISVEYDELITVHVYHPDGIARFECDMYKVINKCLLIFQGNIVTATFKEWNYIVEKFPDHEVEA